MVAPETPQGLRGPRSGPQRVELPEPLLYRLKRRFLGPPLVTESLGEQRLNKVTALGVLAPDCISSTAYGSEEILTILVPAVGIAAFSLLLPITFAVILVLVFVTLSYREVVTVYTKAGGSYVVARENFGPRFAQVAAVALILDYIVTVAVQTAAGTNAVTSAFPRLVPFTIPITVFVVLLLLWGNLRGIKEAGRTFAIPTYLFITSVASVVIIGIVRAALGHLPREHHYQAGHVPLGLSGHGLLMGASLFIVLRAFANGGSSLTGLEAISNGVANFKRPEGINARRVLVVMSITLGSLVTGVSVLAWRTHAVPFLNGSPTVLSQEATLVFGHSIFGRMGFYVVQAATMLILYTGANTSFNGFPNLVSFVASDAFLPPSLSRRGHRLVFSNGILILATVSIALLLVSRANVSALVGVYAIGVFTGFAIAGFGMVKHHRTLKEQNWRWKSFINGFAGLVSTLVVLIFAVTKFTQGAWVVIVIFPVLVTILIRLNRTYTEERTQLEANVQLAAETPVPRRHVVLVYVERFDLAVARALQYARSLSPGDSRGLHFVLDTKASRRLEEEWLKLGLALFPLEIVECPDRRVGRAIVQFIADLVSDGETEVTLLLPRRVYGRTFRSFAQDRTSDRIATLVGEISNASATIIPFQVRSPRRLRHLAELLRSAAAAREPGAATPMSIEDAELMGAPPTDFVPGAVPIGAVRWRQRMKVAGRVHSIRVQPAAGISSLEATIVDTTGSLVLIFQGRRLVPGIETGALLLAEGMIGERGGRTAMINPTYTIIASPSQEESGSAY
ncbi:MAG TPA: amino acid permease [Acidimicrobiales bacterium]|nr:amino acid permease [Acidimicrobiales bacterium]